MRADVDRALKRWTTAGLVTVEAAERIRAFERDRDDKVGLGSPIRLALVAGAILVGAGVLLFVAAHWDDASPASRFALVIAMVIAFHATGAALAPSFEMLSTVLHALGTVSLGAGIYLSGQIFNLAEHWPGGVMLWGAGALLGWILLRDAFQAVAASVLLPIWLVGEWAVKTGDHSTRWPADLMGLTLLALIYLSAGPREAQDAARRSLVRIGAIALIPLAGALGFGGFVRPSATFVSPETTVAGVVLALGIPLAAGVALRPSALRPNALGALWVLVLASLPADGDNLRTLLVFLWLAFGGFLVALWGRVEESPVQQRTGLVGVLFALGICPIWANAAHTDLQAVAYGAAFGVSVALAYGGVKRGVTDLVNLAFALFSLSVVSFYFANFMDRIGRSASLIGFGLVCLVGGWSLERVRRRLVAEAEGAAKRP